MTCSRCRKSNDTVRYRSLRSVMEMYTVDPLAQRMMYGIALLFGLFALANLLGYI